MPSDEAAYARNWWSILLIDAGIGASAAVFGFWRWTAGSQLLGGALVVAGLIYVLIVGRRFLRWRQLRSRAAPG